MTNAHNKGMSTNSVLHSVVGTIVKSLEANDYTIAILLDIEEAFNNFISDGIVGDTWKHELNYMVIRCKLLKDRRIIVEWGDSTIVRTATSNSNRWSTINITMSPGGWSCHGDAVAGSKNGRCRHNSRSIRNTPMFPVSDLPLHCKNVSWKSNTRLSNGDFISRSVGNSRII